MGLRWNFGLGPLRYSAPVVPKKKGKASSVGGAVGLVVVLCCCGAGAVGALSDDDKSTKEPTNVRTSSPARVNILPTTSPTPRKTTSSPKPTVRKTTPPPRPRTTEPKPEPVVYYANCDAVRAAGAAPIRRGDPGYSRKLDRDGDGVGCEN